MRKPKLVEDYTRLAVDKVSLFAHSVLNQTAASSFLQNPATLLTALEDALKEYDKDVAAVAYPSPAQTAYRDQLRAAVCQELGRLAKRLNLDYPGNEPALLSSGLTMVETGAGTANRPPAGPTAVMSLTLLDGRTPGCLLVKVDRPAGTVQNLLRFTTDLHLPEEQWSVAVGGGREREIGPFASAARVWVKGAALTASTTDPVYSPVVSRVVQ